MKVNCGVASCRQKVGTPQSLRSTSIYVLHLHESMWQKSVFVFSIYQSSFGIQKRKIWWARTEEIQTITKQSLLTIFIQILFTTDGLYENHYKWDEDENKKLLLFVPAWLGHLLAFVFHLVHSFTKLNSQSEWSLSLTGSTAIQQDADGLTSARGVEHTTKTRPTDA